MKDEKKKYIVVYIIMGIAAIALIVCVTLLIHNNKDKWFSKKVEDTGNSSKQESKQDNPTPAPEPYYDDDNDYDDDDYDYEELERLSEEIYEKYCGTQSDPIDEPSKDNVTDLDLKFLKLDNSKENKIYSPLSIKYALAMLKDGADGETKQQIENVLGDTTLPKYKNNKNLSFANAMFVNKDFKDAINSNYINTLKTNYNSEIVYDLTAKGINNWISNNTFNLLKDVIDDDYTADFVLINSLAIDMEWKKIIQPVCLEDEFSVGFINEDFTYYVLPLEDQYEELNFNNKTVAGLQFGAVINKYDIVKTLGESNIRKEVVAAFKKWATENYEDKDYCEYPELVNTKNVNDAVKKYETSKFLDEYVEDLDSNYGKYSRSTDFYYYDDTNVSIFAKDLKRYDGVELQYVGIMPKNQKLDTFINNIDAKKMNDYTSKLQQIQPANFEDGYIYIVEGTIPTFDFEYSLDLINNLSKIGVTDVFDVNKADLSPITSLSNEYIGDLIHAAKIEFSNFGIKAAGTTLAGGYGDVVDCTPFMYFFDVPVKTIDISFNKPFMFIIRDKDNGETWFAGTVYDLEEYTRRY